jgi:hypothetical protein
MTMEPRSVHIHEAAWKTLASTVGESFRLSPHFLNKISNYKVTLGHTSYRFRGKDRC